MSDATPPLVGVTATRAPFREAGAGAATDACAVDAAYLDAVRGAGLLPVVLPPNDPAAAAAVLGRLDALLLTGGEDVHPDRYGEAPHPAAGPFVLPRDAWEIALVHAARARALPTLAVCRGAQLLAVALGGTLVQHLADGDATRGARHDQPAAAGSRVHAVTLAPGPLADAAGVRALAVNSYHHQAIARAAAPLEAAAWADDGVIEAVVSTDARWPAIGVQWHPEALIDDAEPWDRRLFAWLAARARRPTAPRA